MSLVISPGIHDKLKTRHRVKTQEIEECFLNHDGRYLTDEREEHATSPPTLWFIGETDTGRRLKVVFVHEHGNTCLRTAFEPTQRQARVYFDTIAEQDEEGRES